MDVFELQRRAADKKNNGKSCVRPNTARKTVNISSIKPGKDLSVKSEAEKRRMKIMAKAGTAPKKEEKRKTEELNDLTCDDAALKDYTLRYKEIEAKALQNVLRKEREIENQKEHAKQKKLSDKEEAQMVEYRKALERRRARKLVQNSDSSDRRLQDKLEKKLVEQVEEDQKRKVEKEFREKKKKEAEKKVVKKKPVPPPINFEDLLKVASEKCKQPVVLDVRAKEEQMYPGMPKRRKYMTEIETLRYEEEVERWKRKHIKGYQNKGADNGKGKVLDNDKMAESVSKQNGAHRPSQERPSLNKKPAEQITESYRTKTGAKTSMEKPPINGRHDNARKGALVEEYRTAKGNSGSRNNAQRSYDREGHNVIRCRERDQGRKRPRILSDSEDDIDDEFIDDEEDADFIDDGPPEEDVSSAIRSIFGYDKRKYRDEPEFDDRMMESSYGQMAKEEAFSLREGIREDVEDIRREKLELQQLQRKKKLMRR